MVTLHVGGEKVGTLADAASLIPEFIAKNHPVEFRDDDGALLGTFLPTQKKLPPEPLIPWDPTITRADIERALAGPFLTLDEYRQQVDRK